MKKDYETLEFTIQLLATQDVITSSVYVQWAEEWNGEENKDDTWLGNIFG